MRLFWAACDTYVYMSPPVARERIDIGLLACRLCVVWLVVIACRGIARRGIAGRHALALTSSPHDHMIPRVSCTVPDFNGLTRHCD
eukprot:scaffold33759_cov39-Prasinocladus_malaysianus.AAC.1